MPPGGKQVRQRHDPSTQDNETIAWRFNIVDEEGPWGWRTEAGRRWWRSVLPKMQNFETMTWAQLFQAAGGRRRGNNHHSVEVEKCTKQAKERLVEIGHEDISTLFSLRLEGQVRIYGIRDGRALKLLWYDCHHGNNARAVYPVKGR